MTTLQPGRVFARDFKIVRPLRAGGMGAVYIVDQLSTGKQRALKVMAPELAQDPAVRERFILEARAASKIESDHVVEIVTAGIDDETQNLYLVMELLKGEELGDAVQRTGPLPIADVAEVLSQLGHALEQAHLQGIVHRDLKPENVFLATSRRKDSPFTVKILDFGIAKLVEDGMHKTGTQPHGSPLFMAPEQTDRKGRICPQTDVWALGLFAFNLLTARSYWRDAEEGTLPSLLRAICVDPLPVPSERAREIGATLPAGFDAWFLGCVNRDIDARFADAGAAVRAFASLVPPGATERKLVAQSSVFTTGMQPHDPMTGVPMTSAQNSTFVAANTQAAVPARPSGPFVGLALGALAIGAAAAGGFFLWKSKEAPSPSASGAPVSAASASGGAATPSASATPASANQCPEGMIFHPAGTMIMGAKDGSEDAKPTHKVTVGAFCLDRTEVTAKAYGECADASECEKPPQDVEWSGITPEARATFRELCTARKKELADHPINCVDWQMASKYCAWKKARLPTEAVWEFAARGTSQRDYPWGDDPPSAKRLNACGTECSSWAAQHGQTLGSMFTEDDGFFATAPVGSYPDGASALGVVDLAGNVWEWTSDYYGPYSADDQVDPKGPANGDERVIRGGAFNGASPDWAKPSYRYHSKPDTYNHAIGFRCAATPAK
jgi:formylglycine-generating enzyme required for sulfatase activity/tRNA A-37 threonylcarbamoyl transferase component Bud32